MNQNFIITDKLFLACLDPNARIVWCVNKQGFTVVSDCDFELFSQIKVYYHLHSARYFDDNAQHKQLAHLVLKVPFGFEIDHINHEPFDNRRQNWRVADRGQQQANKTKNKTWFGKIPSSRFKGVHYLKSRCEWRARAGSKALGYFDDEVEAALAYNIEARQKWGSFAILNQVG